jgi:5-methylcytosine-specific restriction enzyme subunit McrC
VDELRTGVRVTARSWVGIVRFERFEVRVVPKLAGNNIGLVEMIEFATGLDSLRRSFSARSLHAEGTGLFDLIALLLAEGTELILRGGLLADYVEREDELPVLRGRLLGAHQVLRRFGQVDRLVCRFDEHEQNIAENQLLAAALSRCATRVTHGSVRRRVRRLLAIFQEACRPDDLDLEGIRNPMAYHRLNEHYRNPHALAWLILDGLGTRDVLVTGATNCFAFLIDMNRLFEMFVFRLVDTLLAGSGMRVQYQRADRSIILNASTGQPYARVVPDILVERSAAGTTARLAIDAKYKLYDERKLSSSDVYQSFLYACLRRRWRSSAPCCTSGVSIFEPVKSCRPPPGPECAGPRCGRDSCAWPVDSGRPRRADRADPWVRQAGINRGRSAGIGATRDAAA